jgi:hypothetical protein
MVVDNNTLLQVDATVIAGVLILLTIYSLKPRIVGKPPESRQARIMDFIIAVMIVTVIIPFSISAMMILGPDKEPAAVVAWGGFIYLMLGIVLIVLFSRIRLREKTETGKP